MSRSWVAELDVEPVAGGFYEMDTSVDVDVALPTQHSLITENWNYGTDPMNVEVAWGPLDPFGDPAINDAHGFAEAMLDMMYQWTGHDSIDDAGFTIRSRVHYDFQYENAYWDGVQLTYGDGNTSFYALSTDINIVGHELAHGFTENHSALVLNSSEAGALNASFSDVAGTAGELFVEGATADFSIGEDAAIPGQLRGDALRFMCDPPQDGVSIDHLADYVVGMEFHYTAGIPNKAFCLAAKRLSDPIGFDPATPATVEGVRQATQAWFEANANYWTQTATFAQGCQGVIDAAREPGGLALTQPQLDAIRASWNDVGVFCDVQTAPLVCDVTHTAESGTITSPNYPNNYPNNVNHRDCIIPDSGADPTLTFTAFNTENAWDFVAVIDGTTDTVLSNNTGTTLPPEATAPIIVVHFTSDGSVSRPGWRAIWATGATPPMSAFTFVADDLQVSFSDLSTAGAAPIVSWSWDFGDGNTSTAQNPVHSYAAGGTYNVRLSVTDSDGLTNSSLTAVVVTEPPVAAFTFAATGLQVAFTDTRAPGCAAIVAWSWDFGDGNTSTSQSPVHTYAAAGTYSARLLVTDSGDATNGTMAAVTVNVPPVADLSFAVDGLQATFTDGSTAGSAAIVGWSWNFGDGNTSTSANPVHVYAAAETYTVSLVVTDGNGETGTMSSAVTASEPPTAGSTFVVDGLQVSFTDNCAPGNGTIASWSWDSGDGNTSTVQHPVHTYVSDGDYDVSLSVTDDLGSADTGNAIVGVAAPVPDAGAMDPPDAGTIDPPDAATIDPPDAGAPTAPDAGGMDVADDGGCGCEVSPRQRPSALPLLGLFGLLLFRRRSNCPR